MFHKKTISYCVKDGSGVIHAEGTIPETRIHLDLWMKTLPQPWTAPIGWILDSSIARAKLNAWRC
jgi:transposase